MSHHAMKRSLLERLRELGVRIYDIEAALEAPHSADWSEMAIEREDEEVMQRLGASGEAEILRIRAALARIAAGTYGMCLGCGEPIAEARLAAVPSAPLCQRCASGQTARVAP